MDIYIKDSVSSEWDLRLKYLRFFFKHAHFILGVIVVGEGGGLKN